MSRFSDIRTSFLPHPIKKDLTLVEDEAAIKQAIRNLIQTNPTERFYNTTFGVGLKSRLFELIDQGYDYLLEEQIRTAIQNFEPRVVLLNITVTASPDQNSIEITLYFSIINSSQPVTLNILLNRVR